ERLEGKSSRDSIFEACLLRFRPILMTTMAAMLGALPLALGGGTGSELRRPLGITIIGGLIVSQALTLYTTPVVYLYFDRLQHWWTRVHSRPWGQRAPRVKQPVGSEAGVCAGNCSWRSSSGPCSPRRAPACESTSGRMSPCR